ncbi:hypothetical protein ACU4GD_31010 [Cupriavidus basilensis]
MVRGANPPDGAGRRHRPHEQARRGTGGSDLAGGAFLWRRGHHRRRATRRMWPGLVYVAAFAPDEGESLGSIFARQAPPPGAAHIRPDKEGFLWLDPAAFKESFGDDLDDTDALVMAATQSPSQHGASRTSPDRRPGRPGLPGAPGVGQRPHDPAGGRALDGGTHAAEEDDFARGEPRFAGVALRERSPI